MHHLAKTLFQRPDRIEQPLYVVTTVFNSQRYRTRWKLYQDFARMVEDSGAILYTCEIAFGERAFAVTEDCNPRHLRLRTSDEIWFKENSLNLLVQRLPPDWRYVAWIDADVEFARGDWANETIHRLQHYPVVQMWSEAHDLGPNHGILKKNNSFGQHVLGGLRARSIDLKCDPGYVIGGHPGLAWATRRDIWDRLGGLIDFSPLGSADTLMAWGMVGRIEDVIVRGLSENYKRWIRRWCRRSHKVTHGHIGVVPGAIFHKWHGPKSKRGYHWRWKILTELQFDPEADLLHDWQGLWQLSDRSPRMRAEFREYFHSRDEDSNEVTE